MTRSRPTTQNAVPSAPDSETARQPYVRPTLERLGNWSVLTLQQSVGIAHFRDPSLEDELNRYGEG